MTAKTTNQKTHRFSWNGISFLVPEEWNLSGHQTFKGVSTIEMEDTTSPRLEVEWTRPRAAVDIDTVRERYAKASKKLTAKAEGTHTLHNAPPGWSVLVYDMPDARRLVIAFYLSRESGLFAFFRIHLDGLCPHRPRPIAELITSSFSSHLDGLVPWEFYDVAFRLHSDFRLTGTSLQSGNKLMTFQWRLRRLFLWRFSLADMILKKDTLQEWVPKFLNDFRALRGPRFRLAEDGSITATHSTRYPFGHYEEIGRQCFRYHVGSRHDPDDNSIVLWVFNYRRPADLEKLRDGFRLGGRPPTTEQP